MKKKLASVFLLCCFALSGCALFASKIKSFETAVNDVSGREWLVNCSNEVNRGKRSYNTIGYLCNAEILQSTYIEDTDGNVLKIEDVKAGDQVHLTLSEPIDISESNRRFVVKSVILKKKAEE